MRAEEAYTLGALAGFVAFMVLREYGYFVGAAGAIVAFFAAIGYFSKPVR